MKILLCSKGPFETQMDSKNKSKGLLKNFDEIKSCNKFEVCRCSLKGIMFEKHCYLGSTLSELSQLLLFETYYDFLQPFLDPYLVDKIQLHKMDYNSVILGLKRTDLPGV